MKINLTEISPKFCRNDSADNSQNVYIYREPKPASSSKILAGLVAAASVGTAGVAIAKNKTARKEIKKLTEQLFEKDKKIKEVEEKAKKTAEEAENKIKEVQDKTKEKVKIKTVYAEKMSDNTEINRLKRVNSELAQGLYDAGGYIEKLGNEIETLQPKKTKSKKDNLLKRFYKHSRMNFEGIKFWKRINEGVPENKNIELVPHRIDYEKPAQPEALSWEEALKISKENKQKEPIAEPKPEVKRKGFMEIMEGYVAKGIDGFCNFIRNL